MGLSLFQEHGHSQPSTGAAVHRTATWGRSSAPHLPLAGACLPSCRVLLADSHTGPRGQGALCPSPQQEAVEAALTIITIDDSEEYKTPSLLTAAWTVTGTSRIAFSQFSRDGRLDRSLPLQ